MTTHKGISVVRQQPNSGGKVNEPCRNSKEVAEMFGYKNAVTLNNDVQREKFPAPDLVAGITVKRLYWKLSTLEKERKRRNGLT